MKLTKLKYALLGLLICIAIPETYGQLFERHPTNVRYIAGGFNDSRPYFNSLDAALNDVKALATSDNPYVFWVASDSIQIADWDSVYQSGGLSMKDSIDVHYVAVGKIKWAGFGQGGGGSGITSITPPNNSTTHYDFWTWTGQSGLGVWQDRLGENADSIDQRIWELIVYTDSVYLYIENDTLKVRASTITALVTASGTRPDTTLIAYKAVNETITGDWIFNGDVSIGSGSIRLPSANNNTGVSRIIWSDTNIPYWSGSGATGDSSIVVLANLTTGVINLDSLITWTNLNENVRDSIHYPWAYMAFGDSSATITATVDIAYPVTNTWNNLWTDGPEMGDIVLTGDSVQVTTAGYYEIAYSLSYIGNNTDTYQTALWIDNTEEAVHGRTFRGMAGTDAGVVGASWIGYIAASDWITLRIENTTNSGDPTLVSGTFSIRQIR